MNIYEQIARDLLDINAVQINSRQYFTWTSGIQSPIYCDNRLTMSYPVVRKRITQAFIHMLNRLEEKPDVIAGCATAGIPHAAWLADQLNIPMVYVRSKPKEHGKGNQIEGLVSHGKKALVIEDLISTGGSSISTVQALKASGLQVLGVFAIFSYGLEQATTNFEQEGINFDTITNFEQLMNILQQGNQLTAEAKEELLSWKKTVII